mmetsp:Transcript_11019/g.27795  ORF Transcript_11019/g.27795 Transcript_11019/m.27795 type:complete len:205 (-) Transcript_11019:113-727(-)
MQLLVCPPPSRPRSWPCGTLGRYRSAPLCRFHGAVESSSTRRCPPASLDSIAPVLPLLTIHRETQQHTKNRQSTQYRQECCQTPYGPGMCSENQHHTRTRHPALVGPAPPAPCAPRTGAGAVAPTRRRFSPASPAVSPSVSPPWPGACAPAGPVPGARPGGPGGRHHRRRARRTPRLGGWPWWRRPPARQCWGTRRCRPAGWGC